MKKIVYACILFIFSIFATACHENAVVETSTVETPAEAPGEESLSDRYIDITNRVTDAKSSYQPLFEFGLKHGLVYTNRTQTGGVPIMEEIEPFKVGDKIAEKKKETIPDTEYTPQYVEEDANIIYNNIKDLTKEEVYNYLMNVNRLSPKGIMGEGIEDDIERNQYLLCHMGYDDNGTGIISLEDLESMTDEEFKLHVSKVLSYSNINRNNGTRDFVAYIEEKKSQENEVLIDDYADRDKEYQSWYTKNINTIADVRSMDFTAELLPECVVEKDGKYYIDKKAVTPDEYGMVTLTVYGETFSLNVGL